MKIFQPKIPKDVKILEEKPPCYDSVCQFLGYTDIQAFFTYGDTIYNPAKLKITHDIVIHERVHMRQQKALIIFKGVVPSGNETVQMTPELWWGRFLRDPIFRRDQEAKAYAAQYDALCSQTKDRTQKHKYLIGLSRTLAGPLYGNCVEVSGAILLIKSHSKQ